MRSPAWVVLVNGGGGVVVGDWGVAARQLGGIVSLGSRAPDDGG